MENYNEDQQNLEEMKYQPKHRGGTVYASMTDYKNQSYDDLNEGEQPYFSEITDEMAQEEIVEPYVELSKKEQKKLAKQEKAERKAARLERANKKKAVMETTSQEPNVKKAQGKKQSGKVSGFKMLLCGIGSVIIPYLFILAMGLLDSMQIFQVNVYFIMICSILIFILMIAYTVHLFGKRKKQIQA